jgi:RNA polymerase sigma factor (sigma-70 family)
VEILLEEISSLPDREKDIIRQRYLDGETMTTIARGQGCTRQRIHEISTRAMKKLAVRVKKRLNGELFL